MIVKTLIEQINLHNYHLQVLVPTHRIFAVYKFSSLVLPSLFVLSGFDKVILQVHVRLQL